MRLILSRKGFDSSAGGCPNPIFPDGRMLALPIPDADSKIAYRDVEYDGTNIGSLVNQLTKGRHKPNHKAHLDPDIITSAYPRSDGWKPVLGQTGSAQGHLRKQNVGVGDVFLYFGLFRDVERYRRQWRFVPGSQAKHVLWGWMQIGQVINVDELAKNEIPWLTYHPHLHGKPDSNNTIYIASDRLEIDGTRLTSLDLNTPDLAVSELKVPELKLSELKLPELKGAGVFDGYADQLCLTAPESKKPSFWQLPQWFYPKGQPPLTYHSKMERWSLAEAHCNLQCAARGQEFVLDMDLYPESKYWLASLLS